MDFAVANANNFNPDMDELERKIRFVHAKAKQTNYLEQMVQGGRSKVLAQASNFDHLAAGI